MNDKKHICVIAYNSVNWACTRLRIAQYIPFLEQSGYTIEIYYVGYRQSFSEVFRLIGLIRRSDIIFVQRVLFVWLNVILQLLKKTVIFDMDDALHYIRQFQFYAMDNPTSIKDKLLCKYRNIVRGNKYFSSRKFPLMQVLRLSRVVILGNTWLKESLDLFARNTVILPTAVFVNSLPSKKYINAFPVRLGWIGIKNNLFYLDLLRDVFARLHTRYGDRIRLVIVANGDYSSESIKVENIPWNLERESEEVVKFDIGLMPLKNDLFSQGKCSFKAILCMAHGVPTVISPVGMNTELVEHGVNGYLAETTEEWFASLCMLIEDFELRKRMGEDARQTIIKRYSADYVLENLKDIFQGVA